MRVKSNRTDSGKCGIPMGGRLLRKPVPVGVENSEKWHMGSRPQNAKSLTQAIVAGVWR